MIWSIRGGKGAGMVWWSRGIGTGSFILAKLVLNISKFNRTRHRFESIASRQVLFDGHALTHPTHITEITRNVGSIFALTFKDDSRRGVIVSNHHLYWRPEAHYEKLRQVGVMLEEISGLREELVAELGHCANSWPLFFCGGELSLLPIK